MRESGIGNVEGTFPIPFPKKFQHEITVYIGIHFPEFAHVSGLVAGESMYATFTFFLVFYVFRCIYHIEHISKTIILHARKIMMKNSIYMNLVFSFYMYKLYFTMLNHENSQ